MSFLHSVHIEQTHAIPPVITLLLALPLLPTGPCYCCVQLKDKASISAVTHWLLQSETKQWFQLTFLSSCSYRKSAPASWRQQALHRMIQLLVLWWNSITPILGVQNPEGSTRSWRQAVERDSTIQPQMQQKTHWPTFLLPTKHAHSMPLSWVMWVNGCSMGGRSCSIQRGLWEHLSFF